MKTDTTQTGANGVGHKGIISAVATALLDIFSEQNRLPPLEPGKRIDGKVCLVTGANSGLGKAVAIDLARRGGHVIMVCRNDTPTAREEIIRESGSTRIEMMRADLSDLESVSYLCDQLRARNVKLDIAVLNAGLMPLNARKSAQGHELMFAVHFLANRLMLARWLADGVIPQDRSGLNIPRVVFVSSEAHQSSAPIDFDHFAKFHDYGLKDGMKYYGLSKLHLSTFACELNRHLNESAPPKVAVHHLCPGPIASNIARESPPYIKPILSPIMKLLFRSPEKAAEPVIYLACADAMGLRSGVYLHMMKEKHPSPLAVDATNGKLLWEKSAALLESHLPSNPRKMECL